MKHTIARLGIMLTLLTIGCGDGSDGAAVDVPTESTAPPRPPSTTVVVPPPTTTVGAQAPVGSVSPTSTTATAPPSANSGDSSESVSVIEEITIVIRDPDGTVVGGNGE